MNKSLLLCAALSVSARWNQERPAPDPDQRLDALAGEYIIEARLFGAPGATPLTAAGTATWSRSHDGKQMHEAFTLRVGERELGGDAWIVWRPAEGRYELTQIDGFSASTFWLVGSWDEERERIALHDLEETRPAGQPALRWEYHFTGSGFVKEVLRSDGTGGWTLASDYRYTPVSRAGPGSTEIPGVVRLPMEEGFQWPILEVWLEGKGPFRMVLDTGASTTVLNQDLVEELGLESRGTTRIGDPSDPLANEVDVLSIGELGLGDALFTDVPAVGWRTGSLVTFGNVRGVLGIPTFASCLLTLDYPGRAIEVREGALPEPDGLTVLPMGMQGIPTLPVSIAGTDFEAHLDSGNSSSLVLPKSWQERMPLTDGTLRTGRGMRASGPAEFTVGTLNGAVRIGQHVFESPEIRFDVGLMDANVGYALLKDYAVTLDQRNGRIRLSAPASTGTPEDTGGAIVRKGLPREAPTENRRRLGVSMRGTPSSATSIDQVFPGSEAERAGLVSGDEIRRVDGEPMSQDVLLAALRGSAPIRLDVRRGEETLEIVLFPRD